MLRTIGIGRSFPAGTLISVNPVVEVVLASERLKLGAMLTPAKIGIPNTYLAASGGFYDQRRRKSDLNIG